MTLQPPVSNLRASPRPWTRRLWPRLLLLALALLVGFVFAEAAYRIYTNAKYRIKLARYTHPFWLPVPRPEIYRMLPGARGENGLSEAPDVKWTYAINPQGFRGRALGIKQPGIARVIFLGDSYAFGWGLSEDQPPFPAVAERILNQDGATTRVEVMNAAVPGYNTRQQVALLAELAPRFLPDVVVLTYVMNDSEPMAGSLDIPIPPRLLYEHCALWLPERVKEILNARVGLRFFGRPLFTIHKSYHDFAYLKGFEPDSPKWRDTRAALAAAADYCRAHTIQLLLVILPDTYFSLDRDYPFPPIHQTVRAWGHELGIETLDLLPDFLGAGTQYRLAGDGHPNPAAHEVIGRIIARQLEEMLPFFSAPDTIGMARPPDGLARVGNGLLDMRRCVDGQGEAAWAGSAGISAPSTQYKMKVFRRHPVEQVSISGLDGEPGVQFDAMPLLATGALRERPGTPRSLEAARHGEAGLVAHFIALRPNRVIGFVTPRDKLAARPREIFAACDAKLEAARATQRPRRAAACEQARATVSDFVCKPQTASAYC